MKTGRLQLTSFILVMGSLLVTATLVYAQTTTPWLENPIDELKTSEWFTLSSDYVDCPEHPYSENWPTNTADCDLPDNNMGPAPWDSLIVTDPPDLYYKHLTPLNSNSLESLLVGLEGGGYFTDTMSLSLMVHPLSELFKAWTEEQIAARVQNYYQPYIEGAIGQSITTEDLIPLYNAARFDCNINSDGSGRGAYHVFGDFIAVVQHWDWPTGNPDHPIVHNDCNIHVVRGTLNNPIHVANTTPDCEGGTPCAIGKSGLQDAVDVLSRNDDGEIIIHGTYEISDTLVVDIDGKGTPTTVHIHGVNGASIVNSSGECSGYMLEVNNPGKDVTIQDLTLDGDANCTSGKRSGIDINAAGGITLTNLTIQDMVTGVDTAISLVNDGITYTNNITGISISGGSVSIQNDTFIQNGIGIDFSGGGSGHIGTTVPNVFSNHLTATIMISQDSAGGSVVIGPASGTGNTLENSGSGIGIDMDSTSAVTILNNTIQNFAIGIDDDGGAITVGDGPDSGNTIINNTGNGIESNGGLTAIGNTITDNGGFGISIPGGSSTVYGNIVKDNTGPEQIHCQTTGSGAAFNFLGGISTGTGSNCSDGANQLGAMWTSWTLGTNLGDASSTTQTLIFDLGDSAPYNYDDAAERVSNYFAVRDGTVSITDDSGIQYKAFMDGSSDGSGGENVCDPMTPGCWEPDSGQTPREQIGPGYFYLGNNDPTAIEIIRFASSDQSELPFPILGISLFILVGIGLVYYHKRKY